MRLRIGILLLCLGLALNSVSRAENWPQFRGPGGSGLPAETQLPTEWGPDHNIAWKVELPGAAWSQPIVWGNRVFVTTAVADNQQKPVHGQRQGRGRPESGSTTDGSGSQPTQPGDAASAAEKAAEQKSADKPSEQSNSPSRDQPQGETRARYGRGSGGRGNQPSDEVHRWMVMCLDSSTGQLLWEKLAHEGKPTYPIHRTNTYASETPVTDGERVYAYFGMTGLYCFDIEGKLVWSKEFESYPMMLGWGTGSSPVLEGDRLFVQCDNEKASFLAAFDKRTGEELWRVPRDERSNWSTPFVWKNNQRTELVTAGGKKMRAYDPVDGRLRWELSGVRGRCSATPVGTDELLFVGVGGGPGGSGPLVAIRAGAQGDITLAKDETSNQGVLWKTSRAGPPMASPLVYQDCLYILDQGGGIIGCYDAKSGKQHYRQRIDGAKGFTSSPWAFGGKVFCLDEEGQTFVLAPGPELKVLGTNKLDDRFWSSVAVAGDSLLLRGVNHLYCIAPAAN